MSLSDWVIAIGGVSAAARSLKVCRSTIYDWLGGKNLPRATTIKQIVRLSKGKVTYEDIINPKPSTKHSR